MKEYKICWNECTNKFSITYYAVSMSVDDSKIALSLINEKLMKKQDIKDTDMMAKAWPTF